MSCQIWSLIWCWMIESPFPPWESGALNPPTLQRLDFNLLSLAEQLEQTDIIYSPCLHVNRLLQTYFFGFQWFPSLGSSQHFHHFGVFEYFEHFEPFEHFKQSVWILFHHFSQVPSAKSEAASLAVTATLRSSDLGHVRCRRLSLGQFEYRWWSWKATNMGCFHCIWMCLAMKQHNVNIF